MICEKPMTFTWTRPGLAAEVRKTAGFRAHPYYTGYPMVRQARAMVRAGGFSAILKIVAEYRRDDPRAIELQQTGGWRVDPPGPGSAAAWATSVHAEPDGIRPAQDHRALRRPDRVCAGAHPGRRRRAAAFRQWRAASLRQL